MELSAPLPFPADAGFELLAEIGRGGSGVVYAVRWQGKKVALKLPQEDLGERDRAHFLREAALLQKAAHPGVVEVLDSGTLSDGRPYLVMPLLDGCSLAEHLDEEGPLPVDRALELFVPLAEAVAHLHAMGLVHRDIKPENVYYLTAEERLLLLDFGIARETDKPPSTTTQANIVRGTPATMAPERFFGARATANSDSYELALVLYAMLTGALPWGESTDASERLSPKAPSEVVAVPEALDRVILEALSTRPERRPTVRELIDRLATSGPATERGSRRTADLKTRPPRSTKPTPLPDLPSEEEALAMLSTAPTMRAEIDPVSGELRATKASSLAPAGRTTGREAREPSRRSSWLVAPGLIAALAVGAIVSRAWPNTALASYLHPLLGQSMTRIHAITIDPSTSASAVSAPLASASSAPSANAPLASLSSSASAPGGDPVKRDGMAAPPKTGSACRDLEAFFCSHDTEWYHDTCVRMRAHPRDYTDQEEARCGTQLADFNKSLKTPPTQPTSGLDWCARVRDAYCTPEVRASWGGESMCAQGQAILDGAKQLPPEAWEEKNNSCAQLLPAAIAAVKEHVATPRPKNWVGP